MIDPLILFCLLGAFALLFAFSAMEKFHDRDAFQAQVTNYQLIPETLVPPVSNLVILVEISIATFLITSGYPYGVGLAMLLLAGYALAILINLLRGRTHIDCGCLGSHGEGISYYHVARNIFLITLASLCLLPVVTRELIWLDYFVIILFLASAGLIYVTATMLLSSHLNQRLWWK